MFHIQRLHRSDRALARTLFTLMADVFAEDATALPDAYLDTLLARSDFWALAAFADDTIVGGLTAHSIPMTRAATSEVFIYDIAVHPTYQRTGVGRRLVADLRNQAAALGITDVFVLADTADAHAIAFYRSLGGMVTPVTLFTFTPPEV